MLVITRQAGQSIIVNGEHGDCTITLLSTRGGSVTTRLGRAGVGGKPHQWQATLEVNQVLNIGPEVDVTLLGVDGPIARFGVTAPAKSAIHRLETFEALGTGGGPGAAADHGDI